MHGREGRAACVERVCVGCVVDTCEIWVRSCGSHGCSATDRRCVIVFLILSITLYTFLLSFNCKYHVKYRGVTGVESVFYEACLQGIDLLTKIVMRYYDACNYCLKVEVRYSCLASC
jgi:hypothetical protein